MSNSVQTQKENFLTRLRAVLFRIGVSVALAVILVPLVGFLAQKVSSPQQILDEGVEMVTSIRNSLAPGIRGQVEAIEDGVEGALVNLRNSPQVTTAGILPKVSLSNIKELLQSLNPFRLIDSTRNLIESLISNGRKLWDRVFDLQLALADVVSDVGEASTSLITQTFQAATATVTNLTASSFTASGTATFSGSISSSLVPSADNLYDLGSSSLRFRTAYLGTSVIVGGATLTTNSLSFSGAGTVTATTLQGDLTCTDCINATEVEDIYLFNTGDTASGNYNFDAGTLFIDASNNRVGIGTTSPSSALHVANDIYGEDDLYIGASSETLSNSGFTLDGDDLFVAGMAGIEGNVYTDGAFISGSSTAYGDNSIAFSTAALINLAAGQTQALNIESGLLNLDTQNSRIGVGDTSPNNALTVSGNADLTGNLALNGGTVNANYGIELGSWGNSARGTNFSGTLTTDNASLYGDYRTLSTGGVTISGVGEEQYVHGSYNDITLNSTGDLGNSVPALAAGSTTNLTFSGTLNFGGGVWNKATFSQPYNFFVGVGNAQSLTPGSFVPTSSSFDYSGMYGIGSAFSLSGGSSVAYGAYSDLTVSGAGSYAYGSYSEIDVSGTGSTGYGVNSSITAAGTGVSAYGIATHVTSDDSIQQFIYGGEFWTSTNYAEDRGYGVYGKSGGDGYNYGVYSTAYGSATNYSLYADAYDGTTNWGLYVNRGDSYFGGDVGIGTTSPSYALDVETDEASGYAAEFFNDGDNVNRYGIKIQAGADDGGAVGTTYYLHAFDGNGGETGNLKTVDGVFQLADVSDVRLKTNITDTGLGGLEIVNGLRVVDFNWLSNPQGALHHGFIAQEVQEVFPYMINQEESGTYTTSKSLLIPVLVKAVQEQQVQLDEGGELAEINSGRIDELSARLGALEELVAAPPPDGSSSGEGIFDRISATLAELVNAVVDTITARLATITEAIIDRLTVKELSVEEPAVGSGTIPVGQTKVLITNALVSSHSRIFVTATTKTNQVLSVTEKVSGSSFTVELTEPAETEIDFDYWIVN